MKVAEKNVLKGIRKCPQVIPAKSNKGFGTDAHTNMVQNPYFYILSYMNILARSIKVLLSFLFSYKTY